MSRAQQCHCVYTISRCSQNAQHNRYRKARDIRPDIAVMHLNLAQAVDERGEGDPVASYREALRLDPTLTKAHCGLFNTLMYRLEWKDRNAMLRDLQPDNQDIMDCVRSFYAATFSLSSVQSLSVARREARDARQKALLQQQHEAEQHHQCEHDDVQTVIGEGQKAVHFQ